MYEQFLNLGEGYTEEGLLLLYAANLGGFFEALEHSNARSLRGKLIAAAHKRAAVGECAYPGCEKDPIRRSHVISKGLALNSIVEDLNLLTPDLSEFGNPRIREINRKSASTFPGYCTSHEAVFGDFEKAGVLNNATDFKLQLMRSAAREEWWVARTHAYLLDLRSILSGEIDTAPLDKGHWRETVLRPLDGLCSSLAIRRERLSSVHRDAANAASDGGSLPPWMHAVSTEEHIPIALSGSTSLIHPESYTLVFVSFPQAGGRLTLFASSRDDGELVKAYAEKYVTDPQLASGLLTSWMTGTDHWFVRPSWWSAQSEVWRTSLLSELGNL